MSLSLHNETDLFKALGDPLRLRIMALLSQQERCVCDLVSALDAHQSTISRHLGTLRKAGLVQARRQGTWMHYRISPELPDWAVPLLESVRRLAEIHPRLQADRERLGRVHCTPSQPDGFESQA